MRIRFRRICSRIVTRPLHFSRTVVSVRSAPTSAEEAEIFTPPLQFWLAVASTVRRLTIRLCAGSKLLICVVALFSFLLKTFRVLADSSVISAGYIDDASSRCNAPRRRNIAPAWTLIRMLVATGATEDVPAAISGSSLW